MISFLETQKRQIQIGEKSEDGSFSTFATLNLFYSPIANKFQRLTNFVTDCSEKLGSEFDTWYKNFVLSYINSNYDYNIIKTNLDTMKMYCDRYLDVMNVNFDDYINKSKVSKTSIFFNAEEIKKIIQVSNYLKMYLIMAQDDKMKLSSRFHKETFNILIDTLNKETNIIIKLYKIVAGKTYEYSFTDRFMWDYIKNLYSKTTDMHVHHIFAFLLNNILVTCDVKTNPIPYLISFVDESIKWILKNIYKDTIIYSETVATQDVHIITGRDNLSSYAHNDTFGKMLSASYEFLDVIGIPDLDKFNTTMNSLKEASVIAQYITFPILGKVLNIPHRHFITLSSKNAYMLNILLYSILPEDFRTKFPSICRLLLCYNREKPRMNTTYKIKNLNLFAGSFQNFYTCKTFTACRVTMSGLLSKIIKNTYTSFMDLDGELNIPSAKIEADCILFFNEYFANGFQELYKTLEANIDSKL